MPVLSYNKSVHINFLIIDENTKNQERKVLASLRFSFMFLCPIESLNEKDFTKEDEKYKILLRKELHYYNINKQKIRKKASEIYQLGLNDKSRKKFNICNFKVLEEKYLEYITIN